MKTADTIAFIITTSIALSFVWLVCSVFWQFLILASEQ